MKKYPIAYNPILEYWDAISTGNVIVGAKVRKVYQHLAAKCYDNADGYHYDPRRANHVLEFAEAYCHHSKGKWGGKLVKLELWEKAFLAAIFGFVDDDGKRQYQRALLIVGKKNGKSLLASIVGLYMLTADGEAGAEVYAVATKRDQAKIIWKEAKSMARKSPALLRRLRLLVGEIDYDAKDAVFKPLASDSGTLDGLNVSCALMDEIHQWKNGRALYDIIADGTTTREQPLIFITSTAGTIREDIYDELYDDATQVLNGYDDPDGIKDARLLPVIYELDARAEWTDPNCWGKANPGLGTIKSLTQLRERVERAINNPSRVKNLICKDFNIRETSVEAWLTFEEVDNRDTYDLDPVEKSFVWHHAGKDIPLPYPRYGVGGADLSSTTDLTAAMVIFQVPGCGMIFAKSMYWIAEELLEKRVKEDKIPYDIWLDRGLLRLTPGNKVDHSYVTAWFWEIQSEYDIFLPYLGYDSWSAEYWVKEMKGKFGQNSMDAVIQGMKTLSDPMKRLGNDFGSKLIVYNNNPIDKWCFCNTAKKEDVNGNIQPQKTSKSRHRIDGLAALLDAYVVFLRNETDYKNRI